MEGENLFWSQGSFSRVVGRFHHRRTAHVTLWLGQESFRKNELARRQTRALSFHRTSATAAVSLRARRRGGSPRFHCFDLWEERYLSNRNCQRERIFSKVPLKTFTDFSSPLLPRCSSVFDLAGSGTSGLVLFGVTGLFFLVSTLSNSASDTVRWTRKGIEKTETDVWKYLLYIEVLINGLCAPSTHKGSAKARTGESS